jgi:hypothetical protein
MRRGRRESWGRRERRPFGFKMVALIALAALVLVAAYLILTRPHEVRQDTVRIPLPVPALDTPASPPPRHVGESMAAIVVQRPHNMGKEAVREVTSGWRSSSGTRYVSTIAGRGMT